MFGIIKKMFSGLLTSFNLLLLIYILMNTVKNFTTIHLQLNYTNVGSCNTFNDLPNNLCGPNETNVFNMITGINESKALRKRISCECKCKYDKKM